MYRVLLIEEFPEAIKKFKSSLKMIGVDEKNIEVCLSHSLLENYKAFEANVILVNAGLSKAGCAERLEAINKLYPFKPVILVCNIEEEEMAMETLNKGADDYILTDRNTGIQLKKTIDFAIERKERSNIYNAVFDGSPIPMFVFDQESYQILAVNSSARVQYGYSVKEFQAMTLQHIRVSEEAQIKLKLHRAKYENSFLKGKHLHVRKNGEIFYVNVYSHDILFRNKKAVLLFAIDVNKKVKTQLLLAQKNREIDSILNSITDGFFTLNHNWEITFANSIAERIANLQKEEMVGKNIWDVFPDAVKLKFFDQYQYALHNKTSVHFEEFYPPLNGWFAMNVYPYEEGLAIYFSDVTERKQLQEKIAISEQNLSATINNTADCIWSMDKESNLITANDGFKKRATELAGTDYSISEKYRPEFFVEWDEYFNRALAGESFKVMRSLPLNGQECIEEVSFNPIRNKDGEITGISCYSRDITAQQNHLRLIEEQNEQLKKISWMQSHEIRRPLANIMGLINLIDSSALSNEDAEKMNLLKISAEDLDNLVKQISYLSCSIQNS